MPASTDGCTPCSLHLWVCPVLTGQHPAFALFLSYRACCRHPAPQVLLVNGLNAGSRPKKELMDRLGQMALINPVCAPPSGAGAGTQEGTAERGGAAPEPAAAGAQVALDRGALASLGSLGWVAPAALLPQARACGAACCALPPVRIFPPEAAQVPAPAANGAAEAARAPARHSQPHQLLPYGGGTQPLVPARSAQQPADSDVTVASLGPPAFQHNAVQCSPAVAQQQQQQQQACRVGAAAQRPAGAASAVPAPEVGVAGGAGSEAPEQEEGQEGEAALPGAPEWLARGVARVAERSQGSSDAVPAAQLQGRRWGLAPGAVVPRHCWAAGQEAMACLSPDP